MKKLVVFFMLLFASVSWAADTNVDVDANGAIDVAFGGTNQTAIAADVAAILAAANNAAIKGLLSIDDLVTLSGVADGAVNLGAFSGTTINDNVTVKAALQALETAVEGKQASMSAASQAEMEAGTEAALRSMSPLRVAQAVAALAGTGSGTVTAVGDCASGDCLDGSNDGGTYIRLYDGNSHYTQINAGDSTGNLTFTLPTAAPGANDAILVMATTGAISTRASTVYQTADTELGQIAALSPAQGDVLYYNGSAWVLLTAGVNGQYLKTQGAGANPAWGDPAGSGDMTAVGNFTSGAAFTEADTVNGILYFEGTTVNDLEIAFTARNATADRTIYLPDSDGDVVVGPANGFGTDLRLTKTNGTGSLMQITGITVDGSNNVSGVGTLAITSATVTSFIAIGADPADAGSIRLPNAGYIMSEADAAGTDISVIGVDSSEVIQIGASGASGVTITPATTISGALTVTGALAANGGITMGTGDGFTVNGVNLLSGDELDGTKIKDADYGDVTIDAAGAWAVENDSHSHTSSTITLASTNLTDTAALGYLAGTNTWTANNVFGNGDTDTITLRSLLVGGNSRAVWIAASAPTPTYATGTSELYVAGDIETAGSVYAQSFNITGAGESYVNLNSNASTPAGAGTNSLYVVANAWKIAENGTEKDIITAGDSVTWTGATHSFAGVTSMVLPTAAPDANGEIAINNTSEQFQIYINGGLKSFDFSGDSSGYVLKSDGSGGFTLQADQTAGAPTLNTVGNPTADTTIAMDANEEVNFQYTGNFTTGSQFLIQQLTGNPSGGVLFEVRGADPDPVLARFGDGTNYVQISNTGGVTLAGTGSITAGGIVLGDSSPDASGEIGYASNAFSWFANSEDMIATASANLWTFSSGTLATFAFTPAVGFTAATTHSAGIVVADSQTITFDESAADPNDADVVLSATDGVFKIAAANGANNEDLTIDLDQTANTAIIGSSTGLTLITTGSIPLNGAIKVVGKDSDYTIGTDNANEAYGAIFFNTGASTRTFTLPSAAAGMSLCVRNAQGVSQILRIDAASGDYIVKSNGSRTSASGEYYGATADAKNQVCVVAYDSTDWYVTSEVGTWTEE